MTKDVGRVSWRKMQVPWRKKVVCLEDENSRSLWLALLLVATVSTLATCHGSNLLLRNPLSLTGFRTWILAQFAKDQRSSLSGLCPDFVLVCSLRVLVG